MGIDGFHLYVKITTFCDSHKCMYTTIYGYKFPIHFVGKIVPININILLDWIPLLLL